MPLFIIALVLGLALSSCSKPGSTPTDGHASDSGKVSPQIDKRPAETDQAKQAAEAMKQAEQQQNLAEKLAKERQEKTHEMERILHLAFLGKTVQKIDSQSGGGQDWVTMRFELFNKGEKGIKAFKGKAVFNDENGAKLRNVSLSVNEPIEPGKQISWVGSVAISQSKVSDGKFALAENSTIQFVFLPQAIWFEDGSKIEAP